MERYFLRKGFPEDSSSEIPPVLRAITLVEQKNPDNCLGFNRSEAQ